MPYFFARLDFPSPPLSAPGSPKVNKLKLNKDKTELLYHYSPSKYCSITSLSFGNDTVHPSHSARNIDAILDSTMSMLPHVNSVCKSVFYHLRNISRIKKKNFYVQKLPRFSSMLLYPPSLTTAILCAEECFEKASISTECCRPPDNMLPQIRPHHSSSVRSTMASCK